ncbi:MAG: P-loop NTPase [Candidatus Methylomirabilales bacterium]
MAKQERGIGGVAARETWIPPAARSLQVDEPESLRRLKAAMAPVQFKVAITGTERGAGVSTVAVNLALALARADRDGHAGAVQKKPQMGILHLGVAPKPALDPAGMKVLSLETLLGGPLALQTGVSTDWRVVQESLTRVDWKGIDFLLVELPFGIGIVGDFSELFPAMDAACIVTLPTEGARDRIRRAWKFFDASSIPVIGLVSNMEGRFKGEEVEDLGQTFGIPLRVGLPHEPALATIQAGAAPYILANREAKVSRAFFDLADDLVDYLFWLRDEGDQEEEF